MSASLVQLREQAAAVFVGVTLALAGCNTHTEQPSKEPNPTEVKPIPTENKAPESQPGAVLAPSTLETPEELRGAPAYGIPPAPPVYVTPPSSPQPIYGAPPRPAMKYGAPPPPHSPFKP